MNLAIGILIVLTIAVLMIAGEEKIDGENSLRRRS